MIQFVAVLVVLPLLIFWFWMLKDLADNPYLPSGAKNTWFLAFVFLNVVAAFYYYMVEYRNRNL